MFREEFGFDIEHAFATATATAEFDFVDKFVEIANK